jgi:hypothetical protein
MILDGRVEVDDRVVTELGTRVNPDVSVVRVDGARVTLDDTLVYLAINKPRGMQSTMSDDRGRPCIGDLVEHRVRGNKKLFHVGRLDADTEGLITDPAGRPVAVRVFPGNTADPDAFTQIVTVIRDTLGIAQLVLVGDRGMITSARIDALHKLNDNPDTATATVGLGPTAGVSVAWRPAAPIQLLGIRRHSRMG